MTHKGKSTVAGLVLLHFIGATLLAQPASHDPVSAGLTHENAVGVFTATSRIRDQLRSAPTSTVDRLNERWMPSYNQK